MSEGGRDGRFLYVPRPVEVTEVDGVPSSVEGRRVEEVREEWQVEDRWWSEQPLRRRYFELVLAGGSDVVVFFEPQSRRWFSQRA